MPADTAFMDKLVALCKRRGFIYQSSEIYGGIGGFWDYGPLGVELKRNIKNQWWHDMVTNSPVGPDGREVEMVGVDCAIIMNPQVWVASGHAAGFADPMVDCRECKSRFRADQVWVVGFYDRTFAERQSEIQAIMAADLSEADTIARLSHTVSEPGRLSVAVEAGGAVEACDLARSQTSRKHRQELGVAGAQIAVTQMSAKRLGQIPAGWPRRCPKCQADSLTEPRQFNLMFETFVGAMQDASSKAYLRPETAQGIFANFKNVLDTTRVKVPFGIAQVGKAFRNEINPRNYTFRSREFEQMEIEFFCKPDALCRPGEPTSLDWYAFWRQVRFDWYVNLGLKSEKLRLRDQTKEELAHYSQATADIEYLFPFSDEHQELEGVAHRGDYDLRQHQEHSGKDLTYFDDELWQQDAAKYPEKEAARAAKEKPPYRFLPHVIEPSAGADRAALAFLCEAYTEDQAPNDKGQMEARVVMKFHPKLAPIKVAVFPLVNRERMPDVAQALYKDVKAHLPAFFDDKGAIGRRYRRQDEAGTPFCITVDGQTLTDGTVTIRDRDSLAQVRVHQDRVLEWLGERIRA